MTDLFTRAVKEGRELRAKRLAETGEQKADSVARRKLRLDTIPQAKEAAEPTLKEATAALCGEHFDAALIELENGLRIVVSQDSNFEVLTDGNGDNIALNSNVGAIPLHNAHMSTIARLPAELAKWVRDVVARG